jgi:hypothetical protein
MRPPLMKLLHFAALNLFLSCAVLQAIGQTIVKPENQELTLTGVIREVHGYGPPGYGEDKKRDSRITYWALDLRAAVSVPCTPEKPKWASEDCAPVKRLHLFFPTSPTDNGLERKAQAAMGKKMAVTGMLHKADTAGEITLIYMDVSGLQPLQSRRNP